MSWDVLSCLYCSYGCRHMEVQNLSTCWALSPATSLGIPADTLPCSPSCRYEEKILLLFFRIYVHLGPECLLLRTILKHLSLITPCKSNSRTCFWVVDSLHRLMHPALGHDSSEGGISWGLSKAARRCLTPTEMGSNETASEIFFQIASCPFPQS